MPTAIELHNSIGTMHQHIQNGLNRCMNRPLTAEQLLEVEALRKRANDLRQTADKVMAEHRSGIERAKTEKLSQVNLKYSAESQQRNIELQRALQAQPTQHPVIHNQSQIDNQKAQAEHQQRINLIEQEANEMLRAVEEPRLGEMQRQLLPMVTEAATLESALLGGEALKRIVEADFESKATAFTEAEQFHQREARTMLWLMGLMIVLTGSIIFFTFLHTDWLSAEPKLPAGSTTGAIERLAFLGLGRLASLFFCGWGLKHLAVLQRSHSEQAVIYRDRRAALGVAQNLLNVAPAVEHKQEILRVLASGYLNIDQNAFRHQRIKASQEDIAATFKQVAESVKPIVEAVKPVLDADKGGDKKDK